MSETFVCPLCTHEGAPLALVKGLYLCAQCGDLSVENRKAVYADLGELDEAEITRLRRLRGAVARPMKRQKRA